MSKGRRKKRSGWAHPQNINRAHRRWRLRIRGAAKSIERRIWLNDARAADLDEDVREAHLR